MLIDQPINHEQHGTVLPIDVVFDELSIGSIDLVAQDYEPAHDQFNETQDVARNETGREQPQQSRTRTRKYDPPKPHMWKKNINKIKRKQGIGYANTKAKPKDPRHMADLHGFPKSDLRECHGISSDMRKAIFERFWIGLSSWTERKVLVSSLVRDATR